MTALREFLSFQVFQSFNTHKTRAHHEGRELSGRYRILRKSVRFFVFFVRFAVVSIFLLLRLLPVVSTPSQQTQES